MQVGWAVHPHTTSSSLYPYLSSFFFFSFLLEFELMLAATEQGALFHRSHNLSCSTLSTGSFIRTGKAKGYNMESKGLHQVPAFTLPLLCCSYHKSASPSWLLHSQAYVSNGKARVSLSRRIHSWKSMAPCSVFIELQYLCLLALAFI